MQSQAATDHATEQNEGSQNLHAEMPESVVLGGLLRKDSTLEVITALLTEQDFSLHHNRLIFRQISSLRKTSKCADLTAVTDALEISDELNKVGGLSYLHSLTENLPADEDIRNYALILRERSVSRNSPNRRIDEELLLLAELLRKRSRERIRRNMLPIICAEISARVMRDTGITSEQLIDDAIAELIKLKNSV